MAHDKRIVIAGGSGFVGTSLSGYLQSLGYSVVILSRRPSHERSGIRYVQWDARSLSKDWMLQLEGSQGLVNLCGRSVDCIKTPDHQDQILRSRVESTRILGSAMRHLDQAPNVWVQMSTAHIFGDPPELICDEDSALGIGLAPTVGKAWEEALRESALSHQRTVLLRTSFVLGLDRGSGGSALATLAKLTKWGLGGTIGTGKQGMSWIHERDLNRLFEVSLTDSRMSGVYVASAPNPVSNQLFMRELRIALGMPFGLPATEWMVKIGAKYFLKTDPELAIYGRYVVSKRLQELGFAFDFPTLPEALEDLLQKRN